MGFELELVDLACERDERVLFSGLNYCFGDGKIVQIEGPNGSGKTTLLRILTSLSTAFTGGLIWQGQPIKQHSFDYLSQLLYLGHLPGIKKSLSPLENLKWYAGFTAGQGSESILGALEAVGLYGYEHVPSFQLSAGQQRRVGLARLYMDNPPLIWVLDEPFTAIDKHGVSNLVRTLTCHAERGGLVILTTHQDIDTPLLNKINLLDYQIEEPL